MKRRSRNTLIIIIIILGHICGLVVRCLPGAREAQGSIPAFPDQVIQVTETLVLQSLSSQEPGITGSVQGLVGPVSVCSDWETL